jgi:hypothetical protein
MRGVGWMQGGWRQTGRRGADTPHPTRFAGHLLPQGEKGVLRGAHHDSPEAGLGSAKAEKP